MLQSWQTVTIELAFPGCQLRSLSGSVCRLHGDFSVNGTPYDSAISIEVDGRVVDAGVFA